MRPVARRAVLVVALVCAAAWALQGRQGLDWSALADPVQVRWPRVLGAVLLLAALAAAGQAVRRALRRAARAAPAPDPTWPGGEPFPVLLRLLAAALVIASLLVAWWLVGALTGPVTVAPASMPAPETTSADPGAGGSGAWPLIVVALALLVVAVLARSRDIPEDPAPDGEPAGADPGTAALAGALQAAEARLVAHPADARAAIVAAYRAMASHLDAQLARSGGGALASDTPTELLARAVAARLVSSGPAAELTELFREARFSRHPMGAGERARAEAALAAVRAELAGLPVTSR